MCIRDSVYSLQGDGWTYGSTYSVQNANPDPLAQGNLLKVCLLYTSDAADERSSVDLGGRRIIKKKQKGYIVVREHTKTTAQTRTWCLQRQKTETQKTQNITMGDT